MIFRSTDRLQTPGNKPGWRVEGLATSHIVNRLNSETKSITGTDEYESRIHKLFASALRSFVEKKV